MLKLSKIKPLSYWGHGTVPAGAEGALIRLSDGNYIQGNGGAFRTLHKGQVEKLLAAMI